MLKVFKIPAVMQAEAEREGCIFCEDRTTPPDILIQLNEPGGNRGYAHRACFDRELDKDQGDPS